MRVAREKWLSQQCEEIERNTEKGNSKKAYQTLKTLTKTQQNKSTVIEDRNDILLTDSSAVLARWTEYCEELYNYPIQPDISLTDGET